MNTNSGIDNNSVNAPKNTSYEYGEQRAGPSF